MTWATAVAVGAALIDRPSTGNPAVDVFLFVLVLLVGGGSGGAVVALRKDRRAERTDEVTLTQTLQRIAGEALEAQENRHAEQREEWLHERRELRDQLTAQEVRHRTEREAWERQRAKLDDRVEQLEDTLRAREIAVPRPRTLRSIRGEG